MYYAIANTWPNVVFKFSMKKTKVLNSNVVKTYGATGFSIFPPLLGLAINHRCGLMPLHYKSRHIFIMSFSPIIVL
jgi:hypothetical protein